MFKIIRAETSDVFPGINPRNKAHVDYEQFIHRTFYPYILHPYSKFRVYYEIAFLVFIPLKSFIFFFAWFLLEHDSVVYLLLTNFLHFVNLFDVFLRFFTGYIEEDTEIVVLDLKKIARNYLLGSFILDFVSGIPWELLAFFINRDCTPKKITLDKPCHIISFLSLFRLVFRMAAYLRYARNTARLMCWNPYLPPIICIPFFYSQIILSQLGIFILFKNPSTTEVSVWKEMSELMDNFVWCALDLIFINTAFPVINMTEQIPILILSFISSVYFTAYLIKYILGKMTPKESIFLMESRVKCFAKNKQLPLMLKQKIFLYFHILLRNKYHKKEEIFHYVPDTFKADIFFHFCLPLLKGFHAFEDFPTYVLKRLAERLKYQLYLPNEYLITKDTNKLSMFFIQRGSVALYSARGVELYHFETGTSMNGRNMIEGKRDSGVYAISIEVTEVYCLDQKDYGEIMEAYPNLVKEVKRKLNLGRTESTWL